MNKRTLTAIITGNVLLIGGLFLFIGILLSRDLNICSTKSVASALVSNPVPTPQVNKIQGNPVRLIIPSLDLDLKIVPGYYNQQTQEWTLSWDKVQFATITEQPNNISGNTFIYGHESKGVFITLHNIKDGDLAIVKTDNGHTFYYKLSSQYVTNPLDDSVFDYTGKPILTLQTCSGLLFQYRQMFMFDLVRAV
jgi:LPXTG-site transpeptidase (sortase) family protein